MRFHQQTITTNAKTLKLASWWLLASGVLMAAPFANAQVFKCSLNGRIFYQQAPCDALDQSGTLLDLQPPPPRSPNASSADTRATPISPTSPTTPPSVSQPATPTLDRSPSEREADACFAWYLPLLRDPAGAYYRNPSKDGRVLSIQLYATNGLGGYVSKTASCEFNGGKHDVDWTKIHAERLGWRL